MPFTFFQANTTKSVFKAVAEEHNMVYFGRVDQQHDEHKLVRGVTLSPTHRDDHYCIGSIVNRDSIILQRQDTINHPNHSPTTYTWTIVSFDLSRVLLPHLVLDAGHHDKVFYEQFFTKFFQFMAADQSVFDNYDPLFSKRFTAYAPPDVIDVLPSLISPDIASQIAHHFSHLSFELCDDTLIVYTPQSKATKHLLDSMIHAGTWLCGELEKNAPITSS